MNQEVTPHSEGKKAGRKVKLLESGAKNKQRCDFARHLATHGDKARARREAHYSPSKNEYVLACKLANEEDVKNAVVFWSKRNVKVLNLRADAILNEMAAIAYSNITDVWDWDESRNLLILKDITKLDRSITSAIKSVSTAQRTYYDVSLEQEVTETVYKVEMHPKWNALKHMAEMVSKLKPHLPASQGTEKRRQIVEIKVK